MKPEEARKLIGGYATGSLTDEERRALFDAAIHDQALFDALADEEALRELFADESYRRQLVVALRENPPTFGKRIAAWWTRPSSLVFAGGLAAVALAGVIVYQMNRPPAVTEVAMVAKQTAPTPKPVPTEEEAPILRSQENVPVIQAPEAKEEDTALPAVDPLAGGSGGGGGSAEPPQREIRQRAQAAAEVASARQRPSSPAPVVAPREEPAPPPPPPPPAQPLAAFAVADEATAPYAVERRQADGTWSTAPNNTVLARSDEVRLTIAAPATGNLTLTDVTTGRPVWSGAVEQGRRYPIPPEGSLAAPQESNVLRLSYAVQPGVVGGMAPAGVVDFRAGSSARAQSGVATEIVLRYQDQ